MLVYKKMLNFSKKKKINKSDQSGFSFANVSFIYKCKVSHFNGDMTVRK